MAAGELIRRLVAHGHEVEVVTTTIVDLAHRPASRSHVGVVDGATVHYLATPLRYRWMGITPTLPLELERLQRPDVAHVFGFRDPRDQPIYWIYNYKRGSFYPFVPAGGEGRRDSERELRLKAQIGRELPVEPELERWFPLWGIPI